MGFINIEEVRAKHKWLCDHTRQCLNENLHTAGEIAMGEVRNRPTFKPRTGNLQRSADFQVLTNRSGGKLTISDSAAYARAIEDGAKPHPIVARRAPMLVFYWAKIGRWVRCFKVNHPGNRPYVFLWRAHQKSSEWFRQNMLSDMAALASQF